MKFITEKIDFFISPAYFVAPIKTSFFDKLIRMNVFDAVPSISGIASKSLIHITVSSGSEDSNSAADGLMKSWCANKLCQA